MRGIGIAVATLITFAVPFAALRADEVKAGGAKPASAASGAMKKPVTMTPDQLKWSPGTGTPEVMTAVAWGDPNKGAHGAFHKFPAGFRSPLHTHSSDLRIVVISGTMAMAGEDGKETKLPAGSYLYQPNTYKHVTMCEAGSECVAFVVASGKFDLKPVEGKKP
jgi:quercetin dioxygenase-like cupin family protein